MKLVCIDTDGNRELTLYEIYDGFFFHREETSGKAMGNETFSIYEKWAIEDLEIPNLTINSIYQYDYPFYDYYHKKCFIPLAEWRDQQIKEILE